MATEKSRILKSLHSGNGAGRIKRDGEGKAVWEWDTEDGEPEETSVLVGRLHNDDLALVEDTADPENEAAPEKPKLKNTDEGGGFDPYSQD